MLSSKPKTLSFIIAELETRLAIGYAVAIY